VPFPTYPRILAREDGQAYFEEYDHPTTTREYVPGNPVTMLEPLGATSFLVQRLRPGDFQPWHTSPRPHVAITLSGTVEISVGSGEKRVFGAGEYYVGLDTTGQGHETRVLGEEDWVVAVVSLEG
jgi:quercetin dioxygenase-like cupin family protein